jgi:hypothetical protein
MPIVASAVYQYPEPSMGNIQGFDMDRINAELREALLAQCSPLALHVLQFQFAGEIRKSGGLRGLAAKTKQEPLPSAVISQVRLTLVLTVHIRDLWDAVRPFRIRYGRRSIHRCVSCDC